MVFRVDVNSAPTSALEGTFRRGGGALKAAVDCEAVQRPTKGRSCPAGEGRQASKWVGGCLQTAFSAARSGVIRPGARGSLTTHRGAGEGRAATPAGVGVGVGVGEGRRRRSCSGGWTCSVSPA